MLNKLRSPFYYVNGSAFRNRLVLAPMAGISDAPFRKVIWEQECGLLYSEMLSSRALEHGNENTFKMLRSCVTEEPVIVQIYGSDPIYMAKAARLCQDAGVQMLDINMGCPAHKVYTHGAGSALMLNLPKCRELIRQVRNSISIPLSIKIRSGVNNENIYAVELAKIAEKEGVDMIAIHPRTRDQMFYGKSDWSVIAMIKKSIKIPVIGNGDVSNSDDALRMLRETGCDMVMIGRACRGKTWLFKEILSGNSPGMAEKYELIIRHLKYMIDYFGEERGAISFRKHLLWYVEGFRGAPSLRHRLATANNSKEIIEMLYPYYHSCKEETVK